MKRRNRNDGLRKICGCPGRIWAKCRHPWHFSYKWNGDHYRFSLERQVRRVVKDGDGKWRRDRATLGEPIGNKTVAENERDRLRTAIRAGELQAGATKNQALSDTLTPSWSFSYSGFFSVHSKLGSFFAFSSHSACKPGFSSTNFLFSPSTNPSALNSFVPDLVVAVITALPAR